MISAGVPIPGGAMSGIPGMGVLAGIGKNAPNGNVQSVMGAVQQGNVSGLLLSRIPSISSVAPGLSTLMKSVEGLFGLDTSPLGKANSRPDPIMDFTWQCHPPGESQNFGWWYVEEFTLPFPQMEAESYFVGGNRVHFAKYVDVSGANMKLYVDQNDYALAWYNSWFNSTRDSMGNFNYPSRYKQDFEIDLLDATQSLICTFYVMGCFPKSASAFDLQSSNSGRLTLSIDISVDSVQLGIPDNKSAGTKSIMNQVTSMIPTSIKSALGIPATSGAASSLPTVPM